MENWLNVAVTSFQDEWISKVMQVTQIIVKMAERNGQLINNDDFLELHVQNVAFHQSWIICIQV